MWTLRCLFLVVMTLMTSITLNAQELGGGGQGGGDLGVGDQMGFFEDAVKAGSHVDDRVPPRFPDLPEINEPEPFATGVSGLQFRESVQLRYYDRGAILEEDAGPFVWHDVLYDIKVRDASQKLKLFPGERVTIDFRLTLLDSEWARDEVYCMWDWASGEDPLVWARGEFDDDDPNKGRPGQWATHHLLHRINQSGFNKISCEYAYCDHQERDFTGILQDPFDADRKEGEESNCILVTDETDRLDIVVTRLVKPCSYVEGTIVLEFGGPETVETFVRFDLGSYNAIGGSNVTLNWGRGEGQKWGVGADVFYNDSSYDTNSDEDAIATDKAPLFDFQMAEFENYTSYSKGINGVVVDLWGLGREATVDDFSFKMGNDDFPDEWDIAPDPVQVITELGEGAFGSDRVWLIWENEAIKNIWLQVKAPAFTGCEGEDGFTFYFGNIIGETGSGDSSVNFLDLLDFRGDYLKSADIENVSDFDRSGFVNTIDLFHFTRHFFKKLVELITPMSSY